MTVSSERFDAVIAAIDLANSEDPRRETVDGRALPTELVYSQRMTDCLDVLYADASEALKIAARAQHICRWRIPRTDYAVGREGYNAWRLACRVMHAALTRDIMAANGYADGDIATVGKLIRKQDLKTDRDSQRLENVVCVVFVKYYLAAFKEKYAAEKIIDVIRKTARKMDAEGHAALSALDLPEAEASLIQKALSR